jgi:hypothetical protein
MLTIATHSESKVLMVGDTSPGMRCLYVGVMLCMLTSGAYASDRAAHLVNSFQVMCMLDPLDFARSDAKATAMKLPVRQDLHSPPDPSGYFNHAKSWLLPLKSGAHEFLVSETHGPAADIKSCGIGAPDVDAEDFRAELIKSMKLGRSATEVMSRDGQFRNTVWAVGDLSLMLSDGSPKKLKQGIYLVLSNKPLAR